jgi:hypothetical protein
MATVEHARTTALQFLHNVARVHVDGETSGGAVGVVELTGPKGDMPPLHIHTREDETFLVLEGSLTLFVGERTSRLEAGTLPSRRAGFPTSTASRATELDGWRSPRPPASKPSSARSPAPARASALPS